MKRIYLKEGEDIEVPDYQVIVSHGEWTYIRDRVSSKTKISIPNHNIKVIKDE